MIYLVGLFVGILNGIFAAGAGQILVFYLLYFLKTEAHLTRAVSVPLISIASIFALFGYHKFVDFNITRIIVLALIAAIAGFVGAKVMKKIPSDILNLIAGLLILGLTVYKLVKGV